MQYSMICILPGVRQVPAVLSDAQIHFSALAPKIIFCVFAKTISRVFAKIIFWVFAKNILRMLSSPRFGSLRRAWLHVCGYILILCYENK